MSSRELAIRRNDQAGLREIEAQIVDLGGDPSTGTLLEDTNYSTSSSAGNNHSGTPSRPSNGGGGGRGGGGDSAFEGMSEYDQRIHKINENNRRKTKEAMASAHAALLARKKAEEAIVKAKAK